MIENKRQLQLLIDNRQKTIAKETTMIKKLIKYIDETNQLIDERQISIYRLQDQIDHLTLVMNYL
jgi:UDP-N-acetylglucosamine transferase subunit ALG13